MTVFYGARDDVEIAVPRPWLLVVRDAIGLMLTMVFAVSLTFLMWAVFSP